MGGITAATWLGVVVIVVVVVVGTDILAAAFAVSARAMSAMASAIRLADKLRRTADFCPGIDWDCEPGTAVSS